MKFLGEHYVDDVCPPECVNGSIRIPVILNVVQYGATYRYATIEEVECAACLGRGSEKEN